MTYFPSCGWRRVTSHSDPPLDFQMPYAAIALYKRQLKAHVFRDDKNYLPFFVIIKLSHKLITSRVIYPKLNKDFSSATSTAMPSYIVTLKEDATEAQIQAAKDAAKEQGGTIGHEYSLIKAFQTTELHFPREQLRHSIRMSTSRTLRRMRKSRFNSGARWDAGQLMAGLGMRGNGI
ncbi:hypothetical protein B0T25DRAFT_203769 [Lasiosphaeria hispida]|uniref:Inhibitor I9 domain-containing protein n=1 Tax=Lasiosphaeria hispida TaxID=260671 RepID=A0AAJ0HIV1_9PEZI|nr:hypothetical protein B0T25DRAFT_203769 [Lasiosphaeria hispida]